MRYTVSFGMGIGVPPLQKPRGAGSRGEGMPNSVLPLCPVSLAHSPPRAQGMWVWLRYPSHAVE